jgi:hypothetical protein
VEEPDGVGITYFVDGILDCPMEGRYSMFATLSSDAVGEPTPKEASVKAPASFREVHGAGSRRIRDTAKCRWPVAGGREVVSVLASGLSDGRSWAVMPTAWCPGFGLNER